MFAAQLMQQIQQGSSQVSQAPIDTEVFSGEYLRWPTFRLSVSKISDCRWTVP